MEQYQDKKKSKNKVLRTAVAVAAAAAMLVMGVLLGESGILGAAKPVDEMQAVAAIVSLDVNPSVELTVAADERVIAATARNADGEAALEGMDLAGTQLNVAVNAIVGSMLKLGYIDEIANSILISVEGFTGLDAVALEAKLVKEVEGLLEQSAAGGGAILSQTVSPADEALAARAEEYGITMGKAALIEEILAGNARYTFADLAGLSINELNLLAKNVSFTNVSTVGEASDKAYIGIDAAVEIALKDAGLARTDVTKLEAELDFENGRMVYEVEFDRGNVEYEYDIDAESGEIVWKMTPMGTTNIPAPTTPTTTPSGSGTTGTNTISADAAKLAAFTHAGVNESDVRNLEIELDRDDGTLHYDVDFDCNGYEYDYEIDAVTGAVLRHETERDDDYRPSTGTGSTAPSTTPSGSGTQSGSNTDTIGSSGAQSIALSHAGISASAAYELSVELDHEDGRLQYEVEFKSAGYEYDYEIDAETGSVLQWHREYDD